MDDEFLKLQRQLKNNRIFQKSDINAVDVHYGQEQVKKLIPHRDPFLFIDTINKIDLIAMKTAGMFYLDPSNDIFAGHFPGRPVFPGVLQVEMMGQLGLCLSNFVKNETIEIDAIRHAVDGVATRVRDAMFVHSLFPGDHALAEVWLYYVDEISGVMCGQLYNSHDQLCSTSIVEVYYRE